MVLLLSGCSAGVTTVTYNRRVQHRPCTVNSISPRIDSEILPFVKEFVKDANAYDASCFGVKDVIVLENVKDEIAGYCIPHFVVVMSQSFWDSASTWEKRTLVYHELGHCALDLDHTDEEEIMNPYVLNERTASTNWQSLVRKLFTKEVTK